MSSSVPGIVLLKYCPVTLHRLFLLSLLSAELTELNTEHHILTLRLTFNKDNTYDGAKVLRKRKVIENRKV